MGFIKLLVYLLPLCFLILPQLPFKFQLNNACKHFDSYLNLYLSKDCYHTPDNNANTLEIINRYTGLGEEHEVLTEDGYLLTIFRIPVKNPRGVVLLHHGVSHDSRLFVAQQNQSIALYFWRAQFDVWLLNCRGTSYSQRHVNLTVENATFWNYTFHEVGLYDVSATVRYVKTVTKVKKVVYVGLSMGATAGTVYACLRPEEAEDSLAVVVSLAPFYATRKSASMVKKLVFGLPQFLLDSKINTFFNCHQLLEHEAWYLKFLRVFNRVFPFKRRVLDLLHFFLGGQTEEFDPELFNLLGDQLGSASSLKMLAHLHQLSESQGRFQMFDYGTQRNMEVYLSEHPPLYPLEDLRVPIYVLYGEKDSLVPPEDVEIMYEELPQRVKIYGKEEVEGFGHHDFFFGRHRNQRVYSKVLELLDKIEKNLLQLFCYNFNINITRCHLRHKKT